eukprot:scaffold21707_cov67-Isochrysis_galbana.AAC.1
MGGRKGRRAVRERGARAPRDPGLAPHATSQPPTRRQHGDRAARWTPNAPPETNSRRPHALGAALE